ncbi:MAG: ABC transporter permease [Clostridia bacterium]|nr:ABC transporter permease [Clostridia bacterium]
MTIYKHELRANIRSTVTWTLSLMAIAVFFLLVYPTYAVGEVEMRKLFAGFPPALLSALNLNVGLLFSVVGFYAFIFTYIMLCGSIQAMILGTTLIAKEFNRKTADFLFTKPVARVSVITQKLLAGVTLLLVTDVVVIGTAYITASAVSKTPWDAKPFFMISCSLFFVEMMFYALGVLIAVIKQRLKPILGVSLGTVFGFFVIGMLGAVLKDQNVRYIVPFQYYDPMKLVLKPTYETTFVIINAVFVLGAITASYLIYTKKDIHSV